MKIFSVTSLSLSQPLLVLTLCLSLLSVMSFSLVDYPLQSCLMEWRTLPTGRRVSCPEKMRRARMEGSRRRATEARVRRWREEFDVSRGRRLVSSNITVRTVEVNALLAFKRSMTMDVTGALANWTSEGSHSCCRTWKGVICGELGQVTGINLTDLGLVGTIDAKIGDLVHLSFLNLSGNNLFGPIPGALTKCKNLTIMELSANSLEGEISPWLFSMPKLEFLRLTYNRFSGLLPEIAKGGCPSLTNIRISFTNISGGIPSSLSNCQNLTDLALVSNQLNGSIPASLGDLHQLQILMLKDNKLTGFIPPSLGKCTSLTDLVLGSTNTGYNDLTGTIPEEFGNLTHLVQLGLEYNANLRGPIPSSLSKCSKLKILFLGGCSFTSIPREIWSMKNLEVVAVFNNQLSGELPMEVGNCTALTWLDLGCYPNRLSGSIPRTLGKLKNLTTLSLIDNMFTGGIPAELGKATQLQTLRLGMNHALGGNIPSELSNLPNLRDIDLESANFSGPLRVNFAKWPALIYFNIKNNHFTGGIPSIASVNSSLVLLDLSWNDFFGEFPAEVDVSHLSNLHVLFVSHNQISGQIPSWIGNLKKLHLLDLSHNKLTGAIPRSIGNLEGYKLDERTDAYTQFGAYGLRQNLNLAKAGVFLEYSYILRAATVMDLSSNYLEGEIPVGVTHLVSLRYLNLSNNKLGGEIWSSFRNLHDLELLDLSQNNLAGPLPPTLPSGLNKFNVSHNNLRGAVPTIGQYLTFPNSSFLPGNPGLCGFIVRRSCDDTPIDDPPKDLMSNGRGISDYISAPGFAIGAAGGFLIVVVTTIFSKRAQVFLLGTPGKRGPRAIAYSIPRYECNFEGFIQLY